MECKFKAEVIENWESFLCLENEWNPLLRESRANIIFLTWEWVHAWYSVVGKSASPFVIVVRDPVGTLVGLAPLYFTEYRFLHTLPYRVLRIVADYATGAECLNWIARADVELEVYRSIAVALSDASERWDCIWMPYIPGWTGAVERILSACVKQRFLCNSRTRQFGHVELPADAMTFFNSLSRNRRSEIRRQQKAVYNSGKIEIRLCHSDDEIEQFIDALMDLHYRRWKSRGEVGTFKRKPTQVTFYRHFLPIAHKRGWLRMYGLFFEKTMKAVQFGYVYNNVFYQIQEGFDTEFSHGVGNVLRAEIISDCISKGIKRYDFLGEMSEHKRRWSAIPREGSDIFCGSRKIKNYILFNVKIWPTGKYFKPWKLPQ